MINISKIPGGQSVSPDRSETIRNLIVAGRTDQALKELELMYPTNAVAKNLSELHDAIQKAERMGKGGTQAILDASDKITMAALKLARDPNHQPDPISLDLTPPVAEPVNLRPVGVAGVPIAAATFKEVQSKLADGKIEDALQLLANAEVNDTNGLINLRAEVATMQRGARSGVGTQHLKFDGYAQLLGQALSFAYQGRPQSLQIDASAIQRAQAELGGADSSSAAIAILRAAVTSPSATLDLLAGIDNHIKNLQSSGVADSRDLGPMQASLNMEVIGLVRELGSDINQFQSKVEASSIESPPVMVATSAPAVTVHVGVTQSNVSEVKKLAEELNTAFEGYKLAFRGELQIAQHQEGLEIMKSVVGQAFALLQPGSDAYQYISHGFYRFLAGLEFDAPVARRGAFTSLIEGLEGVHASDLGPVNAAASAEAQQAIAQAEQNRQTRKAISEGRSNQPKPMNIVSRIQPWEVSETAGESKRFADELAAGRIGLNDSITGLGRMLNALVSEKTLPANPYTQEPLLNSNYV